MNSFATDEQTNTDILIFTKRLDTLLAATKYTELEANLVRPALKALSQDPRLSATLRERISHELDDKAVDGQARQGLNLLRVLIANLHERQLVSSIYDDTFNQVQFVKDAGYEYSIRRALQALLALQGFEANLTDWAD